MNPSELLRILSDYWAISTQEYLGHRGTALRFLNGNTMYYKGEEPESSRPTAFSNSGDDTFSSYDEAPKGSIAIIPINGVMTRENQMCGPVGTATIADRISIAVAHKNIDAIILKYNSGGGAVSSINPLSEAIQNANKPILSFVDDLMASAALMTGVNADLIIASHEDAEIGSLGVMASFANNKPVEEKKGTKFIEAFAKQSTLKNKAIRMALEGDLSMLIDKELTPLAESLINKFKAKRGDSISDEDVYRGEMYFANKALEIGLIDEIGSLNHAVKRASELANKNKKTQSVNIKSNNHKTHTMDKNKIPALMFVLGLSMLEGKDNKFHLSSEQMDTLEKDYSKKYGKTLRFKGTTIAEDGSADFSENALFLLNADFTKASSELNANSAKAGKDDLKIAKEEFQAQLAERDATIAQLSDEPETVNTVPIIGKQNSDFRANATGINAITPSRPWNEAAIAIAEGRPREANAFKANGVAEADIDQFIADYKSASSTIDHTQMDDVLGNYHRETATEINEMLVENEEVNSLFPMRSTGIKDIYASVSDWIENHLQPRNTTWTDKGGNEFQAEEVRLKNWEVTRTFAKAQMFGFIESWLATKTVGTDPYQPSFVSWFITKIMRQISLVERPLNAIKGVHVEPASGVPGKSINSQDGLLKQLQNVIADYRVLPAKIGKGEYGHIDASGNPNRNHVYQKNVDLILTIPQNVKDAFKWNFYMSKEDKRQRDIYIKDMVASDANFKDKETAHSFQNFNYIGTPHLPDGLYIITMPNNALQLFREKADDNRMYVERLKRDTHVHMDGARGFLFPITGKKYDTLAELQAAEYKNQRIFTNAEFGAYTTEPATADDTTPSVANHNVIETVANTGATVISTIDDSIVGQTIFIVGGSDTNPAVIEDTNANFIGLVNDITFNVGVTAEFEVTATGVFTLVALYDANNQSAIQFAADDATPDISGGYKFLTSSEGTLGNVDITDFDNAQVGKAFTVIGSGGTNPSTITKAGKFQFISATWTGTSGTEITLKKRADGNFLEVL